MTDRNQAAWDALRRERDMLSEKVKELEGECGFDQRNAAASQSESESLLERCDELAAQVDVMRAALSSEHKDAARYRWLRERGVILSEHDFWKYKESLDAAIDAAIAKDAP